MPQSWTPSVTRWVRQRSFPLYVIAAAAVTCLFACMFDFAINPLTANHSWGYGTVVLIALAYLYDMLELEPHKWRKPHLPTSARSHPTAGD